jgi:hypothetical protein
VRNIGLEAFGSDAQATALRHSIARIDDEIEQDLLHMNRAGGQDDLPGSEIQLDFDVFGERAPEHRHEVLEEGVQRA